MAFHLSLADVDAARNVANRAFERIEFHQEGEKVCFEVIFWSKCNCIGTSLTLYHVSLPIFVLLSSMYGQHY